MKLRAIAAALVMAMLLSGCSAVGLDVQTLMHPPKASGEREAIHTLLQKKAGENITLKYPHSGDYRSAIIMQDITGDKQEEAVAFYQSGDDGSGIHMVFINKVDGKWNLIASFHNSSTQVDKVCFGDVNGDGKNEVIVGWENAISNTGELCVYTCSNNKVTELNLKQTYSQMAVADFNDDGRDEILTASTTMQDQPAVAKLMRIKSNQLEIMGIAHLDISVTKYAPITVGRINEKQYGVVLDGSKSSSTMVTEVLYWDKSSKTLQSPFYDRSTQSANYMLRNTATVSQDINNDKIIEIPIASILPGCQPGTTEETSYSINWKRYDTTTRDLIPVMSTVMNSSGGYWFLIPDMWKGKISVKTDEKTHSMTFYQWNVTLKNPKGSAGVALLKIQVFTDKEWNGGKNDGYFKLMEQNNTVYAANVSQPSNTLSMNIDDIKNSFKLISQE
jgi:hypothetical protein